MVPHGYTIAYGNNAEHPAWLVMWLGQILQVCSSLRDACDWLEDKLAEGA